MLDMGGLALKRKANSLGSNACRRLLEQEHQELSRISLAEIRELNKTACRTTLI